MSIQPEQYKGIEFVRISSLSPSEQQLVRAQIPTEKIIKILRDNTLLNDCIQYRHYLEWKQALSPATQHETANEPTSPAPVLRLALKP